MLLRHWTVGQTLCVALVGGIGFSLRFYRIAVDLLMFDLGSGQSRLFQKMR